MSRDPRSILPRDFLLVERDEAEDRTDLPAPVPVHILHLNAAA